MDLHILYEDRFLIVCEKPVGILSQRAAEESKDADMPSLLDAYFKEKGERSTAYVLHRLDRGVGGVMVYAKEKACAAAMSGLIAQNGMVKEYYAVCHGDVASALGERGVLEDLLFKDSSKNKSYVTDRMRKGVKKARLSYEVLGVCQEEEGAVSLVRVRLETGRTHQIRVQFSSRGHSLVGDARYGSKSRRCEVALYSAFLGFVHPKTKKELAFSLGLPKGYPWELFSI